MKPDHPDPSPAEPPPPAWENIPVIAQALSDVTGVAIPPADVDGALAHAQTRRMASSARDAVGSAATRSTPLERGALRLRSRSLHSSFWRGALPGAAITLGVALVAAYAVTHRTSARTPSVFDATHGTVYTTRVGERATLVLSDGSRVMLAPQTTLRVDPAYGSESRIVSLSGEAYFDVANTTAKPFTVRNGGVSAHVLGTAFNIRHYPEDAVVRVAVTQGKVTVQSDVARHASVTLTAGMVGDVNDSTATATSDGDMEQYTVWTKGNLVFHKAPTAEVLAALTRWYGYRFQLADPILANKNVTVWLSTESLPTALGTLKLVLDADLTFKDSVVTLRARRTSRVPAQTKYDQRDSISTLKAEVGR